jgi:hypothetical protein
VGGDAGGGEGGGAGLVFFGFFGFGGGFTSASNSVLESSAEAFEGSDSVSLISQVPCGSSCSGFGFW